MTLPLPLPARFHPAWLALAVPPVLWLATRAVGLDADADPGIRPVALALWIGAGLALLLWLERADRGPGSARWAKEIRPLLPGMLVSLIPAGLMPIGPSWLPGSVIPIGVALGGLLMAASTFGQEFEDGTLSALLAQPGGRRRILATKWLALSLALLFAGVALELAWWDEWGPGLDRTERLTVLLLGLILVATTPGYTLLARNGLAGMAFTVAVPLVLLLSERAVQQMIFRLRYADAELPGFPVRYEFVPFTHLAIPLYLLAGLFLTYRGFVRMQVLPDRPGAGSQALHPFARPIDRVLAGVLPGGPLGVLVRKELQLQVIPWLMAGIQIALWGLWMTTGRRPEHPEGPLLIAGMIGGLVLLVTGATCIAEERQLGTLAWQLTLPASAARQWAVKCGVTLVLALGVGVLLPLLLLTLGLGQAGLRDAVAWEKTPAFVYSAYGLGALLLVGFGIHASSISRRPMEATGIAAAGGFVHFLIGVGTGSLVVGWLERRLLRLSVQTQAGMEIPLPPAWIEGNASVMPWFSIVPWVAGLVLFGTQVHFAGRNFRRDRVPVADLARQGLILAVITIVGVALTAGLLGQLALWAHQAQQAAGGR